MKSKFVLLLLIVTLSVSAPRGLSQDQKTKQDQDVIKISAELVQVDVLVTDRNNKPVSGLKAEDFELYDNGKLQHISNFTYEESGPGGAGGEGRHRAANAGRPLEARDLKRVMAFVVDTLHMKAENVDRTRQLLRDFVDNKMAPGDLVLVLPTAGGSGVYQQLTSDRRLLRTAINQLHPAFVFETDNPSHRSAEDQRVNRDLPTLPDRAAPGGRPSPNSNQNTLNTGDLLEEADIRATLTTINNLVRSLAKLPGRKIGVLISEGFAIYQNSETSELRRVNYASARANVVFYAIDPGGIEPVGMTVRDGIDFKPRDPDVSSPTGLSDPPSVRLDPDSSHPLATRRDRYLEAQDSVFALAAATGGKFYHNNNEINRGLDSVLEENSAYYMLGFQPEGSKWDGKFHTLRVQVRERPDLVVATRRGYLAANDKPRGRQVSDPHLAEILDAINSPLVRRDIDLQLTAFYRDDQRGDPVVTATVHIDAGRLNFLELDGKHKTRLDTTGFVFDAAGRVTDSFSQTTNLELDAQKYRDLLKTGWVLNRTASIRPGVYQIKILAREAESGLIGTAAAYVEIPDIRSGRLALSSIITDSRMLDQTTGADATKTSAKGGVPISLSQRVFPRTGNFAYTLIVYNAKFSGKTPLLSIRTTILKDDRTVFKGQPRPVEMLQGSTPARILTGGMIQLSALGPGAYTLQVTVIGKPGTRDMQEVHQEIDFKVEDRPPAPEESAAVTLF